MISIPYSIELHTHSTSGISEMLYLKAIDAGVDIIDTAISHSLEEQHNQLQRYLLKHYLELRETLNLIESY